MDLSIWSDSLVIIARELGVNVSHVSLSHITRQKKDRDTVLKAGMDYLNLTGEVSDKPVGDIPPLLFPVLVPLKNNQAVTVYSIRNGEAVVTFAQTPELRTSVPLDELEAQRDGVLWIIRKRHNVLHRAIDDYIRPMKENWLFALISRDIRFYIFIALGALFGNVLAIATAIFSMQVYDRVIPGQSIPTLWVLFIGVVIALLADMLLRTERNRLADAIGKKIDLFMSSLFYARALSIKNSARPASTGTFIAQIREIDHIRELLTSTTVIAVVDMPFIIIFIGVIWSIGGLLALPVIAAIPLIVIPGLLAQLPFSKLAKKGIHENAVRNAMLVETVEGLEDIKLTQTEDRFLRQWRACNVTSAQISLEQRFWSYLLTNWCQFIQQLVYVCVIAAGVYLVIANDITTGTLIACSILSSRTVAPLGQIAQVMTRWQQARMARTGLDDFMAKPVEQHGWENTTHLDDIKGNFDLKNVKYRFNPESHYAIDIQSLTLRAGEKVAIIGTIGAGKSTLLRVLSGMGDDFEGQLKIDDVSLRDVSVHDIRRCVGYLQQDARLFCGTLRDNLLMGNPTASPARIAQCLSAAGAASILQNDAGLDLMISEGGKGLSGGQRQALLVARTLLKETPVLFLDEPTASMDEKSELHVVNALQELCREKTLVVVTHRQAPLKLVDRIIVMDQGKIVLDGPKKEVLARVSQRVNNAANQGEVA